MQVRMVRGWPAALLVAALAAVQVFALLPDAVARELWPQERSDLKPDAAIRFGALPNGLRYVIKPNHNPEGTVSLKLRIAAGSLHENENERGVAHYLEHMAFNGSTNYPEGEMFKALQRMGLAIGANANAATDFDNTTFSLSLPSVRAETLSTGLNVLREIGGRLTLSAEAITRERGVIQSEERARDTPAMRSYLTHLGLLFEGQRYPTRFPIGEMAFVRSAGPKELRSFYERYYRPERSLLVVAGAVDPAAMEAKIAAVFGDWKQVGSDAPADNFGKVKARKLTAGHATQANLEESVTLSWITPEDERPDSRLRRREIHQRLIAFTVLNRRLSKLSRQADAPFIDAHVQREVVAGGGIVTSIQIRSRGGDWAKGMAGAEQELRRALVHGLQQGEVEREAMEQRSPYLLMAQNANTRGNGEVADMLMNSIEANRVPTDTQTDLDVYTANIKGLKAADVTKALKLAFSGAGPVVFVAGSKPIAGGDEAIRAAYARSVATPVAAPAENTIKAFNYRDFGTPGAVADRQAVRDIGTTLVRFANGVRLNVKPTEFEKDKVSVVVRFAGGYLALPKRKPGLAWALPFAFVEGGLGQLDIQELEQTEPGHFAGVSLDLEEDAYKLTGETVERDVLLQLQVLAAFFSDPAYRPDGLRRMQGVAEGQQREQAASASGVLSSALLGLLRDGDPRWAQASNAEIDALTMDDVKAAMAPSLAQAPIEVTIVGHVQVQAAIDAVGKTFGAFAPRKDSIVYAAGARDVRFPAARKQVELRHEGRADQAAVAAAWPGPDFLSDPRRDRVIAILNEIIQLRLIDEVREAQGGTYVPFGTHWASKTLKGYGFMVAGVEPKPEAVDLFFTTLEQIAQEMREGTFTPDVLERARKPVLYQHYAAESTNAYWIEALSDIQADPRNLASVRTSVTDYDSITKEEIVAVAKTYLDDKRRVDIRVLPK
ncbi:MAG: insulinase family protein [Alphaproteobacteria bacterium]|nr:insulinase family protein [Alphaproteobacteria bacterium]